MHALTITYNIIICTYIQVLSCIGILVTVTDSASLRACVNTCKITCSSRTWNYRTQPTHIHTRARTHTHTHACMHTYIHIYQCHEEETIFRKYYFFLHFRGHSPAEFDCLGHRGATLRRRWQGDGTCADIWGVCMHTERCLHIFICINASHIEGGCIYEGGLRYLRICMYMYAWVCTQLPRAYCVYICARTYIHIHGMRDTWSMRIRILRALYVCHVRMFVYVCMCVYIYIYICIYTCRYARELHWRVHAYTDWGTYGYMYVHQCINTHTHRDRKTVLRQLKRGHRYSCIHTYIHIYIYIYIHIFMYVYMVAYAQIWRQPWDSWSVGTRKSCSSPNKRLQKRVSGLGMCLCMYVHSMNV